MKRGAPFSSFQDYCNQFAFRVSLRNDWDCRTEGGETEYSIGRREERGEYTNINGGGSICCAVSEQVSR